MSTHTIALVGNPNAGKSTLFNLLTNAKQKVGNWSGVTIEQKIGLHRSNAFTCNVIDLPGIYSLTAFSTEEALARDYLIDTPPALIVQVIDGNSLERSLYLTLQLIQLRTPLVLAINMMDEVAKKGITLDTSGLSQQLGCPIVPIAAHHNQGIDQLLKVCQRQLEVQEHPRWPIQYSPLLESVLKNIEKSLKAETPFLKMPLDFLSHKLLEGDPLYTAAYPISNSSNLSQEADFDAQLVHEQYQWIETIVKKHQFQTALRPPLWQERLDDVLTNKWLGLPLFALMMYLVFFMTFSIGGIFLEGIDLFFSVTLAAFTEKLLINYNTAPWLISLIIDGVIGGVGSVLTFLPNILILFTAIALLEDTGYMARVAYLMDRLMTRIGLNGKAIVPMIMGFGCNTPAIMSTRILEKKEDRLIAILINPFMSCGARLPIYVLLASIFFPTEASFVTFSLYMLGMIIAVCSALLFKRVLFKSEQAPFLLELPPYRLPTLSGIYTKVSQQGIAYLKRAGTLIFTASVVIWFLLAFGPEGFSGITGSFGQRIGSALSPLFQPMGFGNWQASLSLLTGIVAKEIVISNMSIIYGLGDLSEGAISSGFQLSLKQIFTPLSAYAFMVFSLLYTPCIAVIGVMKSETGGWKWPLFSIAYTFAIAWLMSFIVYRIGLLWQFL